MIIFTMATIITLIVKLMIVLPPQSTIKDRLKVGN